MPPPPTATNAVRLLLAYKMLAELTLQGKCSMISMLTASASLQVNWYELSTSPATEAAQPDLLRGTATDALAAAAASTQSQSDGAEAAEQQPAERRSLQDSCEVGAWTAPTVDGPRRPHARYEHAVAGLGLRMFLVGGNHGAHGPTLLRSARSC